MVAGDMNFDPRCVTHYLSVIALILLSACSRLHPDLRAANGERYQLTFHDEFDGDGPLDPAHWGFETGFVRNQELQWYQPENAVRRNGVLLIEGRREEKPNPRYVAPSTSGDSGAASPATPNRRGWANRERIEYTSASVNTRGKHAWLYGRFEMRAKIDVRRGSWPAFWTLGTRGPWPANGEVDIMEFYDDTLLFNVAWQGANGAKWNSVKRERTTMPAGWENQFHVWRMDWDEQSIKLYLDDVLMNSQDLATTINAPGSAGQGQVNNPAVENPFHWPAYLLVNQAMGGQHGGDPAASVPIRYEIDYVRVYQTKSQIEATRRALSAVR
jgi:beta-glucanase (GH16 family)